MRLITHNMLQCHVKNCNSNNFPLQFQDTQVELIEADYNPEFLINMLPKLEWEALVNTALQVRADCYCTVLTSDITKSFPFEKLGISSLPAQIPEDAANNEEFLKALHGVILEVKHKLITKVEGNWSLGLRRMCSKARWCAQTVNTNTESKMASPTCCLQNMKSKKHKSSLDASYPFIPSWPHPSEKKVSSTPTAHEINTHPLLTLCIGHEGEKIILFSVFIPPKPEPKKTIFKREHPPMNQIWTCQLKLSSGGDGQAVTRSRQGKRHWVSIFISKAPYFSSHFLFFPLDIS